MIGPTETLTADIKTSKSSLELQIKFLIKRLLSEQEKHVAERGKGMVVSIYRHRIGTMLLVLLVFIDGEGCT